MSESAIAAYNTLLTFHEIGYCAPDCPFCEAHSLKARIAELEQQVRWIDTKFISNNSVPVDRVVITRAEWEGLCR